MLASIHYRICQSFNILQATIVRLVFCTHNLIATYFLYDDIKDYWCLLNLCGTIFLLIELVVTIIERKGLEPKWYYYLLINIVYSEFLFLGFHLHFLFLFLHQCQVYGYLKCVV